MTDAAPRHVAVIDIGKTNAKLAIVAMDGLAEIAVRSRPNTVLGTGPYPHYDIDGLWSFILDALRDLNAQHPIDAIAVATHGAACVLVDRDGGLALPVLDYEHDGPATLAADYDAIRPPFAETGSPRLPGGLNLGAQLFWQQRRFPDAFGRVATILMYPQYWSFRLTGVRAGEVTSLGAHTDLWNPESRDYASLADRFGWRALFAPLRSASDCLGPILPDIAARTGMRPDVPVYCGIHDSNASLLLHLTARRPPFAVVSTGTWVIAMSVGGRMTALDPARDTLINVNAYGDPVASARFMGGREHAILTEGLEAGCTEDDVAAVLARRIFMLPSVQAGSGPFPHREAEWKNADGIRPGERRAAISFYLAIMTAACLDLIGADGPIIADGPFAGNQPYVRMLAATTGRSVIVADRARAGAALLAARPASPQPQPHAEAPIESPGTAWSDYARDWNAEVRREAS